METKIKKVVRSGSVEVNKMVTAQQLKKVIGAILEQQKYGRLCPQTVKDLQELKEALSQEQELILVNSDDDGK